MDSLRIGVIAKNIYTTGLSAYMGTDTRLRIWIIVRILMIVGIVVFVWPKTQEQTRPVAFWYGALYGLILYFVYNGTNATFFAQRPRKVFVADCLRGMFACWIVSIIRRAINK